MTPCAPPACGGAGERSETEGEIVSKNSDDESTPSALRAPPPLRRGGQIPIAIAPRGTGEESLPLTPAEHDQATRGRVYILQHLHDRLDAAVADAYGWAYDLSEQEVLGNLVALNKERRAEEATGKVRWLRPDYQAARFGRPDDMRDKTIDLDLILETAMPADGLPAWPKDRDTQPFEVERAVRSYGGDITIPALARAFKGGGKRIELRLSQILSVLADYGRIQRAGEGRYRG